MENKKESGQQAAYWRTSAVRRDGHTSLGYQRFSAGKISIMWNFGKFQVRERLIGKLHRFSIS
jgi:hypothetical protein